MSSCNRSQALSCAAYEQAKQAVDESWQEKFGRDKASSCERKPALLNVSDSDPNENMAADSFVKESKAEQSGAKASDKGVERSNEGVAYDPKDVLICNMFALITGWALRICEISGDDPRDFSRYPMSEVKAFRDQMKKLGVDVNAIEGEL